MHTHVPLPTTSFRACPALHLRRGWGSGFGVWGVRPFYTEEFRHFHSRSSHFLLLSYNNFFYSHGKTQHCRKTKRNSNCPSLISCKNEVPQFLPFKSESTFVINFSWTTGDPGSIPGDDKTENCKSLLFRAFSAFSPGEVWGSSPGRAGNKRRKMNKQ